MSRIIVKSRTDRFRRAGIEFSRRGIELDSAALTPEQATQIATEPMLVVTAVDASDKAPPPAGAAPARKAKGK